MRRRHRLRPSNVPTAPLISRELRKRTRRLLTILMPRGERVAIAATLYWIWHLLHMVATTDATATSSLVEERLILRAA